MASAGALGTGPRHQRVGGRALRHGVGHVGASAAARKGSAGRSAGTQRGSRVRPRQVDLDGDPGVGVQVGQHLHQPIRREAPEVGFVEAGAIRSSDPGETRRLARGETTAVQRRDDPRSKDGLGLLQVGFGSASGSPKSLKTFPFPSTSSMSFSIKS